MTRPSRSRCACRASWRSPAAALRSAGAAVGAAQVVPALRRRAASSRRRVGGFAGASRRASDASLPARSRLDDRGRTRRAALRGRDRCRASGSASTCAQRLRRVALDLGDLADRVARREDAAEAGGDQQVADLHVGVLRQVGQLERGPRGRCRARCVRTPVRITCTGIACSGSVIRMISAVNGPTR